MAVRSRPDARSLRVDAIVAAALAFSGCVMVALSHTAGIVVNPDASIWVALLGSVLLAAPLVLRRLHPVLVAVAQSTVYIVFGELGAIEFYASQIALFLGFYSIGAWEAHRPRARWVRLVLVVIMAAWLASSAVRGFLDPETGERGVAAFFGMLGIQVAINAMFFGGAWIFGDRAWASAIEREDLDRANAEIRAQQAQLAEQAVALERMRIARELHDVVAHHVSAMGVQAGAARRVLDRDRDAARDALQHVERSAREAIGELRSLVLTLRSEDDGTGAAPDLDAIEGLVVAAREAGQEARLATLGERPPLSPAVELTAYRVVQEALTNARKHAGAAATIDVRLRFAPDSLEVEVADDGHGSPHASRVGLGSGMGLIGMRERVTAIGGELEAGPKSRGGFLVRASLPVVPTVRSVPSAPSPPAGEAGAAAPASAPAASAASASDGSQRLHVQHVPGSGGVVRAEPLRQTPDADAATAPDPASPTDPSEARA